nr:GntR family transcriptional regulator [uncultured Microbacterium sp.]
MPQPTAPTGLPGSVLRVARPSTVDLIVAQLRSAIFSGALAVGSPLGEVDIAAQLGVSRGPLREAAQRLVQEGVLTALPGRGLRVSVIGSDGVADLYTERRAIEKEALRMIAAHPSADIVDQLRAALAVLEQASARADARAIGDADLAFHQTLVDAAGSARLSRSMSSLTLETRIASFSAEEGYSVPADVSPTYATLLDALSSGDAAAAVAALDEQFDAAVARLTGRGDIDTVETDAVAPPPPLTRIDVAEA